MDTPQTTPEEQTSSVKSLVSLTPSSSTVCPKELADSEQKQPNDACVFREHAQNRTSDDRRDTILTDPKSEFINNIDDWELLSYSLDATDKGKQIRIIDGTNILYTIRPDLHAFGYPQDSSAPDVLLFHSR